MMTYGPIILDFVTKQFDFSPVHLDNAILSRKWKCVFKIGQAPACVHSRHREKENRMSWV